MLARHLDIAESRFIELLALAPDASTKLNTAVRSCAVYFFAGANRLNTYVTAPRPDGIDIMDWVNLRDNAWKDFRDCIGLIDDGLGVENLLREGRVLDAKRAAETPSMNALIGKLADGLARLDTRRRGDAA